MDTKLMKEKLNQIPSILKEKGVNLWLIFVRESGIFHDPSLSMILGTSVTWQSAFIITDKGDTIAIVGSLDRANVSSTGIFKEVKGYVSSIRETLLETLEELNPSNIAINFSRNDVISDGLTYGMYLNLMEYLKGTRFQKMLISAEGIMGTLRGRKIPEEVERIRSAIYMTEEILNRVRRFVRIGMTERDVAEYIKDEMNRRYLAPAWDPSYCPAVFTGPESVGAHASPTSRRLEEGHIMHIDFGVRFRGFCSDLQRCFYLRRKGEEDAPSDVQRAFIVVKEAIELARSSLKEGVEGWKVDEIARRHIVENGFEEYPHALGHQIGREAHDGSGLLCPIWDRYGTLPFMKVEVGQVYTLEPRVNVKGRGVLTIEEIVIVERDGAKFLSTPQENIWLV